MQSHEFDIAIIGGGCIGCSILYEFCHRGIKNIVLVDNGRKRMSATAHSGGMLRVFHESSEHIDLALKNFIRLEVYQRSNILMEKNEPMGNLYFFNKKRYRTYIKNLLQMEKAEYPFEVITSSIGTARFPQYSWNDEWAIYEPRGNQLSTIQFMDDLLAASVSNKVKIIENFEVNRICFDRYQYKLIGQHNSISAKTLVLAGGFRSLTALRSLGLKFNLEVKKIKTYRSKRKYSDSPFPNYFDRESLHFGCFSYKENVLFSDVQCERVREKKWEDIEEKSANDLYAPNRIGLLGKIPGFANLFIATGWGGTAFKFSLEIAHRAVNTIEVNL